MINDNKWSATDTHPCYEQHINASKTINGSFDLCIYKLLKNEPPYRCYTAKLYENRPLKDIHDRNVDFASELTSIDACLAWAFDLLSERGYNLTGEK